MITGDLVGATLRDCPSVVIRRGTLINIGHGVVVQYLFIALWKSSPIEVVCLQCVED